MTRQPVHTIYGGAQLFRADAAEKLGRVALAALERDAGDIETFAQVFDLPLALAETVRARVVLKLTQEPVEDLRIDFEDGYGYRPDAEEDAHAAAVGRELARGLEAHSLPPFVGIRVKALGPETSTRSLRTLELVIGALSAATKGRLPKGFVVTLPKVERETEVRTLTDAFARLERELGLPAMRLRFELMVETPRALFTSGGSLALPSLVEAGAGRCVAAHFGAYDYTAALQISAAHQALQHPACDLARQLMQLALAGTEVSLSDGATNVLPVAPHKRDALTPTEVAENRSAVHDAWKTHACDVRHGLVAGFYQGWDLHPAQLVSRYAAVYAFFRQSLPAATARLQNFVARAAQASLVGTTFDDAASGQGLLNFFTRGVTCGALDEDEVLATGLSLEELRGRSFAAIAAAR